MKKNKMFGVLASISMVIGLIAMPIRVGATPADIPEQVGNRVYLNGNDAVIVEDPEKENGAIVKSAGKEFKVIDTNKEETSSYVYAGSNTKKEYGTVNITMTSGMIEYIIGGNENEGLVDTANITMNGGTVGMIHGGSKSSNAKEFKDCSNNTVNNSNIVMNGGTAKGLIPGTFALTYVKNAKVTVNGGTLTGKGKPAQTGILTGTNGRIDNLTINVNGGTINDISLGQRAMITKKAVMNINGGDIGDIYAGSFYNDGETKAGWWGTDPKATAGSVNYGQAKTIDINVGSKAVYNNIYGGFQYHEDKAIFESGIGKVYPSSLMDAQADLIKSSSKAPLVMNLSAAPTKKITQKYAKEVIDSKESFIKTNWLVTDIEVDKTTATLEAGKTVDLKATITPTNATDKIVAWTSSNTSIASVDNTGKVTAIAEGTATITATAGDKSATCVITVTKVPAPVVDVPTIDTTTPPKEVIVGVQDKASQKIISDTVNSILGDITSGKDISKDVMSEKTLQAVKEALAAGKTVSPKVNAKTVDVKSIDKTIVSQVNELVKKLMKTNNTKATVAQYLDLGVLLMADSSELGSVNQLDKPIEFTVGLPTDLAKAGREFYVVRIHNGVAEKLATKMNSNKTLTFETDKFSTFAIVYEEGTVKTSDDSQTMLYASFGTLAVVGAGLVLLFKKKEELMK